MGQISSISLRLHWLFKVLTLVVPFATILYWSLFSEVHRLGFTVLPYALEDMTINTKSQVLGCLIGFIPVFVICYGFYQLSKLFKCYSNNKVFTLFNVTIYKKLSFTLFAYAFADNLFDMLISYAVSFQNPSGESYFFIGVNSTQIVCLLTGFVVLMIARVMQEAYQLEHEAELTI